MPAHTVSRWCVKADMLLYNRPEFMWGLGNNFTRVIIVVLIEKCVLS